MTREEAIKHGKEQLNIFGGQHREFIEMAIKALEQASILDKIRTEIEQITDTMGVSYNQYVSKIDVLQILDKYKAESEDKE